jgi:phosphatidylserine/phosphatidylglycerophosphate/cardiolipin synthase-like enzyme
MMVGQPIDPGRLLWARGPLGANGDTLLWTALCETGSVREPDFVLRPRQLATFLAGLWSEAPDLTDAALLVWTLPRQLAVDGLARDGYVQTVIHLVEAATDTLTLVSPYFEPVGMGRLHEGLLAALQRGVAVTVLAHGIEDLSSLASASLEALRRDSVGLPGLLRVLTVSPLSRVFFHLKIVVADERRAIVGSANVTDKGFDTNLEVGVLLGSDAANEIERVVRVAIGSGLVDRAYSNR